MKTALHFFKQTLTKKRLAHLYLITGPKGSGKVQLTEEVAYLILNQDKPENPYLKTQVKENKLSNLIIVEPEGLSIKKEQILLLQNEFSKTALVSGPRIYIIKNVERMTQSAANSLLKFMEEPNSKTVYGFLLTESKDQVISTIASRSQIIQLKSMDEKDLEQELLKIEIDPKVAAIAPYLTKNIEEAVGLAQDPNFLELLELITDLAKIWPNGAISLPIYLAPKANFLARDRELFQTFLELLLLYFLDLVHYKVHQDITYAFLREQIQTNSDLMSVSAIHSVIEHIQDTLEKQTYYINLDLAFDNLVNLLEKRR